MNKPVKSVVVHTQDHGEVRLGYQTFCEAKDRGWEHLLATLAKQTDYRTAPADTPVLLTAITYDY